MKDNKETVKRYRMKYPERSMIRSARGSARKRGILFDLSEEDIKIPDRCPILRIPLVFGSVDRRQWPTIDRIDNSLGYVKGNIGIISNKANIMKSDMTLQQVERLLAYMQFDPEREQYL